MTDRDQTRERFVAAIADKVNPESVEEAHFFQPMKQGLLESGVAVVAVREPLTGGEAAAETPTAAEGGAENRFTVYTARYRLTLKGPDRGKFDFAIHPEADAPLITVDQVVQGVQRRAGDADDAEKLSGEEFRALLPDPVQPPEAP